MFIGNNFVTIQCNQKSQKIFTMKARSPRRETNIVKDNRVN